MKTRLAIIAALAVTAGVSTGAFATTDPSTIAAPAAPAPVQEIDYDGPVLFPSEQGAFKALEVASQLVEASILQNGCATASYDLTVKTKSLGQGYLTVDGVTLNVSGFGNGVDGRIYDVTGGGTLGYLSISDVIAHGSYNIGSKMQELTTDFDATSLVSQGADHFRGTIIKDYARPLQYLPIPGGFTASPRLVNTVIDYGYQQIQKNDYIAAKYWQQSQTWRQNGVRPGTWWVKNRVAPYGECTIEVVLQGKNGKANQDNAQGFFEVGTISVSVPFGSDPGIPGVDYAK